MRITTLVLIVAAAAAVAAPLPGVAQSPTLPERPCRLESEQLAAASARCSTLEVPEDPAAPDGAKVEIFVARIAAQSATPRPDPLLLIAGGPGQGTVDMYLQLRGAFEPVRRERDLILVDQRGTGRSAGGFGCSVPDDLALDTAGPERLQSFIAACLGELEHDPRLYTTSVAVQDLERVRAALGIEQWNLYGVSYGTRVAQHYLRRFPERARAVVLDGVVPPELALGPDIARDAQAALDRIFARCAADAGCETRFANVSTEFHELLARLAAAPAPDPAGAQPGKSGGATLGPAELRALVRFMSYNAATVALLPVLLHEAYAGNAAPLARQAGTLLRGLPASLSFPMSNSVVCTEDVPFVRDGEREGLGETYLGTTIVDALRTICARWPVGKIDADFKTPVISDRPVLLLSGGDDPITPPAYAERVAATLSHAQSLVSDDQGHGLLPVGCVPRLLRAFLSAPESELDASCLKAEAPTPFFLSLLGPGP